MREHNLSAWLVPLVCALGFAIFLGYSGVPTLRHDWGSWIANGAFFSNSWSSVSGWRTDGFGSPRPYPTDYLLIAANALVFAIFRDYGGFFVDAFIVGYVAAAGAVRLARCWSNATIVSVAAALFAVFNPWVYNEVVAGHLYMVLAYGGVMLLLSEMLQMRPRPFLVGAFLLLTMGQLQFFAPSLAAVAVWTATRRASPWPLVVVLVASLPIWIGMAGEGSYLRAIPYTLPWQSSASVNPWSSLSLGGYFALYADALPWYTGVAACTVAGLAAVGTIVALFRTPRSALWPLLGFFAVWVLVGGSKGILGTAYGWLVQNVPATGLYRELYDAVAFLAIAYVAACSYLCRTWTPARWLWLTSALALVGGWAMVPPARYWVPASLLPTFSVHAPPNTRYALMPPLQPIRFLWGSGLDPDAVALTTNVTPLNTQQFSYPESAALMRYALTGDAKLLEALSVAEVIERPQYRTDVGKLGDQLALAPPVATHAGGKSIALDAFPELTLAPLPGLSAIPQPVWGNALFFGDARAISGPAVPDEWRTAPKVEPVLPQSSRVSAADGWVDARSAFVALPALSQGIGGTITTNPFALLSVDPAQWTLAFVSGELQEASGRDISRSTQGYRWLPPMQNGTLRCRGLCIVVAQSVHPYETPAPSSGDCRAGLQFALPASWLAIATLPPSPRCLLRYNVRFDRHWVAWAGGVGLAHVAIDSTANGWVVPPYASARTLVIVESVAAFQFVVQAFSLVLLLVIAVTYGVRNLWPARVSS